MTAWPLGFRGRADRLGATFQEGGMSATGIGGVFFRADNPEALARWYRDILGVGGEGYEPWRQAAGPTLFMPFDRGTDYWPADRSYMLNFRVPDLDAVKAVLLREGVAFHTDEAWDTPETGRFLRVHDPEGNPVELWEPPKEKGAP
jgi:catechol 2,3-dioxygenase-like lactoylglutathione lyase family enzyme